MVEVLGEFLQEREDRNKRNDFCLPIVAFLGKADIKVQVEEACVNEFLMI